MTRRDRQKSGQKPTRKPQKADRPDLKALRAAGRAAALREGHGAPKGERTAPAFRASAPETVVIYGAHAVREALTAGRRKLLTLYATGAAAPRIEDAALAAGMEPQIVEIRDLERRLGKDAVHQGLLLEARPLPEADIADIVIESGVVLALDQITDPQNVGAILRSAAAFAVDALVLTDRNSPELGGALAKAASGALEHVRIASIVNLARGLEELSERGFQLVGLDSDAAVSLQEAPLRKPVALVLGAEGAGLRRLTRERCDVLARLDLPGPIRSLNVSNACAAALTVLQMRLR